MQSRLHAILQALRLTNRRVWLGRLVVWCAAAGSTLILVLFAKGVDVAIAWFDALSLAYPWSPFILTTAGGMVIVYLTRRYFEGAQGSGIPQVIAAQYTKDYPSRFVSLRIVIGKILLGTAALGCGFSAGREGPSVQIGASLMLACQRFLPRHFPVRRADLLLAGGAVGIAAAFNTPLAGIVFAIEELGRRFESRTNSVLLVAIVFAGIISIALQGNYTYFGRLIVPDASVQLIIPVLLLGVCGGVLGGIFSRLLLVGSGPWRGRLGDFKREHPVKFAGICAFIVVSIGVATHGLTFGSGYFATQHALHGGSELPFTFALMKMLATVISYIAGIPGGIFAPCLSVGAGLGQNFAALHWVELSTTAWMALGMVAFLAGVTQAPITSFIIVMEMIDGQAMILSLIATALLASMLARAFCPPLYHAIAHRMLRQQQYVQNNKLN